MEAIWAAGPLAKTAARRRNDDERGEFRPVGGSVVIFS
jgi:hypothetical protein